MLISIDFIWFLHIVFISLCYSLNFPFSFFFFSSFCSFILKFFFLSSSLDPEKAHFVFHSINTKLGIFLKSHKLFQGLVTQCRCTFVYELRQCLSYWNLFSSSKGGKIRKFSKQFNSKELSKPAIWHTLDLEITDNTFPWSSIIGILCNFTMEENMSIMDNNGFPGKI